LALALKMLASNSSLLYRRLQKYSGQLSVVCRCTAVPGPPLDVEVSEVVAWKAPESDGGSAITGYIIERSLAASARWLRVNKQPVCNTLWFIKTF